MAKILYVANIFTHFLAFHIPYIKMLSDMGHEVHVAAGGEIREIPYAKAHYSIPIQRNIFNKKNIIAYNELKDIIRREKFDLIHCHTAMGGAIGRLAASTLKKRNGTIVLYTAHGFHFYKGGPISRWLLHYPLERILAYFTDGIITINHEDYKRILNWNPTKLKTYIIPGVGFDSQKLLSLNSNEKKILRQKYGFAENDFILIYVGRFSKDKNQIYIVRCVEKLKEYIPNLKINFAGDGPELESVRHYIQTHKLDKIINILGYRNDIPELLAISDIGVSSCKNEGFGINIVEEMRTGLPVVASINRGHCELIDNGKNGFLFSLSSENEFIESIKRLYQDKDEREQISKRAKQESTKFEIEEVKHNVFEIYKEFLI